MSGDSVPDYTKNSLNDVAGEAAAPPARCVNCGQTRDKHGSGRPYCPYPQSGNGFSMTQEWQPADLGVEAAAPAKPPHKHGSCRDGRDPELCAECDAAPPAPQAAAPMCSICKKPIAQSSADESDPSKCSFSHDAQAAAEAAPTRCAICSWPLKESTDKGCVIGNCSMRPFPATFYEFDRACKEYNYQFIPQYRGAAHTAEAEPPSAREFWKGWKHPSVPWMGKRFLYAGITLEEGDALDGDVVEALEAYASSLRDTNEFLERELANFRRNSEYQAKEFESMRDTNTALRANLEVAESRCEDILKSEAQLRMLESLGFGRTKVSKNETQWRNITAEALRAERDALMEWKESAMVQLGKHDKLRQVLPSRYLGWDVIDAAMDYIEKHEAQPA